MIAVWCPAENSYKFFKQHSLAFGQIGAVYGFNVFAKALRLIAVRLFARPVTI